MINALYMQLELAAGQSDDSDVRMLRQNKIELSKSYREGTGLLS